MTEENRIEPSNVGNRNHLMILAFVSGMAVMGVEMTAARLMAPFFGTSLSIWTVIIGSTMVALTAGYYVGGSLAQSRPSMGLLCGLLFCSGVFIVFLPYIAQPAMEITLTRFLNGSAGASAGSGGYSIALALAFCAMLISLPVVILGMTSPFLIRLDAIRSPEVGRVAGRIFALSTVGSILGTFLPALLLILWIGTRLSFLVFGGLLIVATPWALGRTKSLALLAGLLALVTGLMLGTRTGPATSEGPVIAEKETRYQYVRIYRVPYSGSFGDTPGKAVFMITDAGLGMQSMWVEGRNNTDSWQDFFALVPRIYEVCGQKEAPRRLLVIGLGGAVAPYLISKIYPDTIIDGVEIDGGLVDVARPHFPFSLVKNLNVHIGDGRLFLRTTNNVYDVIIVDVFRPPHIPFHVATEEFFLELRQHLAPDGIVGMNIGSRGQLLVFSGIANTVASVFPYVSCVRHGSQDESGFFSNRLLIAANRTLSLDDPHRERQILQGPGGPEPSDNAIDRIRRNRQAQSEPAPLFEAVKFDPGQPGFTDDSSSLETVSEREFLGLILGGG